MDCRVFISDKDVLGEPASLLSALREEPGMTEGST
jgi:hypothetical protein